MPGVIFPSGGFCSKLASPSGGLGANTTTEDVLSSTSSFTHVTGLTGQNAEDLLLSPASSADHSASAAGLSPKSGASAQSPRSAVLSPKSLFSTPTMKNGKMAGDADQDVTPTNIPLPPEEEDELATPKSSHQSHDSSQVVCASVSLPLPSFVSFSACLLSVSLSLSLSSSLSPLSFSLSLNKIFFRSFSLSPSVCLSVSLSA